MTNTIKLAVNGTLMRGLELNRNLVAVGAEFSSEASTAPEYRLWSIEDAYPAMIRYAKGGGSVELEIWTVSPEGLVKILQQEPPGLSIGKVVLSDGEIVLGVIGEPAVCEGQKEITAYGGWRTYIRKQQQ